MKHILDRLKREGAPGFTYYNVTGHGKEQKVRAVAEVPSSVIVEDILPRIKVEVICEDSDVDKILNAICTEKSGDGMVFVSSIRDAYRLKTKQKLEKIE